MEELIASTEGTWLSLVTESQRRGRGCRSLIDHLKGKITLFSGHSGVGKSTLINQLIPGVELRTGSISLAHFKGMHTTTFSQMVPLPYSEGGYLIDTPGIKGFGMLEMEDAEVSHYFPRALRGEYCLPLWQLYTHP